jgi:DNA-binding transcriptional MerR regulator
VSDTTFTLDELARLVNLDKRTIRYYVQIGLIPRPIGETKAARYGKDHLERAALVKNMREAGVSLEGISQALKDRGAAIAPRKPRSGGVQTRSHITVCAGVEIQISPEASELTTDQVRELIRQIAALAETFAKENEL